QSAIIRASGRGTSTWLPLLSTGTTYMLQSDASTMISPAMFERFVLPDLEVCCESLDHPFYHLDGPGEIRHLDHLLSLSRLRGIQWVPGAGQPPPEDWPDLLRRIRDAGKLCQVGVTPQGALSLVRRVGGRGFYFVIHAPDGTFPDDASALSFLDLLAREDVSGARRLW
ncbi:MAG: hypothetical protein IT356_13235, partial [Gemmatimonadaceae bacterium]|nr:hypothetical protein [Gemmatimonadaceae bacterium]